MDTDHLLSITCSVVINLSLQSVKSRILERKLQRVLSASTGNVSKRTVESMCDNMSSLYLVKVRKELEEICGVAYTEKTLEGNLSWSRKMKDNIRRVDHEQLLKRCTERAPLIAEVEKRVSWARLWDTALNFGLQHTRGILCNSTLLEVSVMEHVLTEHWAELRLEQETDIDWLLNRFVDLNIGFVAKFRNLYCFVP